MGFLTVLVLVPLLVLVSVLVLAGAWLAFLAVVSCISKTGR